MTSSAKGHQRGGKTTTQSQRMTFDEAVLDIISELTAAGFVGISTIDGFPLVQRQEVMSESIRLLEFVTRIPCERKIFAEGMLFIPIPSATNDR